jgi:hypothetical protein
MARGPTWGGWIKGALEVFRLPGDIQALLTLVGGLSVVSGALAWVQEGFHWAVFIASGVFCFGAVAVNALRERHDRESLENKLRVHELYSDLRTIGKKAHNFDVFVRFKVFNDSDYPIYYEVPDAVASIEDKKATGDDDHYKGLVAAKQTNTHGCGAIRSVDLTDDRNGELRVEILYGRQLGKPSWRLRFRSKLSYEGHGEGKKQTQGNLPISIEYSPVE